MNIEDASDELRLMEKHLNRMINLDNPEIKTTELRAVTLEMLKLIEIVQWLVVAHQGE